MASMEKNDMTKLLLPFFSLLALSAAAQAPPPRS